MLFMLYETKHLNDYTLYSLDGKIGKVKELFFDDLHWTVRYLVADTGKWLKGKRVLIAPSFLTDVDQQAKRISVNLTKKQIEESPHLDSDKPVSRQYEDEYHIYYGIQTYYLAPSQLDKPPLLVYSNKAAQDRNQEENSWEPELQSTRDVIGNIVEALDGPVGCIEDFIVDTDQWKIRYFIVDTQDWWPGKRILVAPQWAHDIKWGTKKIFIKLNREPFKQLQEYSTESMLTREYEIKLHQSCNREGYWDNEPDCIK
jgi:hypothetical protein